jgi:hypothetical protein
MANSIAYHFQTVNQRWCAYRVDEYVSMSIDSEIINEWVIESLVNQLWRFGNVPCFTHLNAGHVMAKQVRTKKIVWIKCYNIDSHIKFFHA